jgi:hypothetical protein
LYCACHLHCVIDSCLVCIRAHSFPSLAEHSMCFQSLWSLLAPRNPEQVNWRKITGRQSNQLVGIVTKLDEQVQSTAAGTQKSLKTLDVTKIRRKKHYRLESEEKPAFPFQQKNFYNHVMENKEVVKTLSLLSTCTLNIKTVCIQWLLN